MVETRADVRAKSDAKDFHPFFRAKPWEARKFHKVIFQEDFLYFFLLRATPAGN